MWKDFLPKRKEKVSSPLFPAWRQAAPSSSQLLRLSSTVQFSGCLALQLTRPTTQQTTWQTFSLTTNRRRRLKFASSGWRVRTAYSVLSALSPTEIMNLWRRLTSPPSSEWPSASHTWSVMAIANMECAANFATWLAISQTLTARRRDIRTCLPRTPQLWSQELTRLPTQTSAHSILLCPRKAASQSSRASAPRTLKTIKSLQMVPKNRQPMVRKIKETVWSGKHWRKIPTLQWNSRMLSDSVEYAT